MNQKGRMQNNQQWQNLKNEDSAIEALIPCYKLWAKGKWRTRERMERIIL